MTRNMKRGFTLVEILIVVIILGILAAIVIPQFTNASQDARKSSLTSQLQTIRSQVELYKLQHRDEWPTADGSRTTAWSWTKMTTKTDADGAASADANAFGPYLQADPVNPIFTGAGLTGDAQKIAAAGVTSVAGPLVLGAASGATTGWVFSTSDGKFYATSKLGTYVYDEGDANADNNDL